MTDMEHPSPLHARTSSTASSLSVLSQRRYEHASSCSSVLRLEMQSDAPISGSRPGLATRLSLQVQRCRPGLRPSSLTRPPTRPSVPRPHLRPMVSLEPTPLRFRRRALALLYLPTCRVSRLRSSAPSPPSRPRGCSNVPVTKNTSVARKISTPPAIARHRRPPAGLAMPNVIALSTHCDPQIYTMAMAHDRKLLFSP